MEKLKNYIKDHKALTIASSIILIISLILTAFLIFLIYTKRIYKNNEISTVSAPSTSSTTSSVDQLLVDMSKDEENSISTENSEEEKQEEEKKLEEESKKKQEEEEKERKIKEEEQRIASLPSYYIKVNRAANTVTVYKKDANGNFTIPVKSMICSTGYASPRSGVYSSKKIGTWHTLFGGVYGQYCTHITGDILFHSVPYLRYGDNASLEYWAYDKLGTTASAGCIRLTTADAQWIYYNCKNGTQVEFYSSSDPGPLGKPSAIKISDEATPYKNWDPTDPNPNNPWRNKPVAEEPKTNSEPQPAQQPVEQPNESPKQEEVVKAPQTNEININQTTVNPSPSVTITSINNTLTNTNTITNTNNTTNAVNNASTSNMTKNNTTNSSSNNTPSKTNTNSSENTNNTSKFNNTDNTNKTTTVNASQNVTN